MASGEYSWRLALTFISTPFFLATPLVVKRCPDVGRLYFPAVGAINTFFCVFIFGEASGVELFLAPCLVIAALLLSRLGATGARRFFRCIARRISAASRRYGTPLLSMGPDQYDALLSLNSYSAATLTVIASWMLSSAWSDWETQVSLSRR